MYHGDLEFLIPAEHVTYIRLFVRDNLTGTDWKDIEETDYTGLTNNFLHSLFSQCSLTMNGTTVTQITDLYQYLSYLETLLNHGSDASTSQLTNGFWYIDNGHLLPCDPNKAESRNIRYIARLTLVKKRKGSATVRQAK